MGTEAGAPRSGSSLPKAPAGLGQVPGVFVQDPVQLDFQVIQVEGLQGGHVGRGSVGEIGVTGPCAGGGETGAQVRCRQAAEAARSTKNEQQEGDAAPETGEVWLSSASPEGITWYRYGTRKIRAGPL